MGKILEYALITILAIAAVLLYTKLHALLDFASNVYQILSQW